MMTVHGITMRRGQAENRPTPRRTAQPGFMMGARDKQSIDQEAIQWFVMLRDEDATEEDHRRFDAWLGSEASHLEAWREVERMWSDLDLVAEIQRTPAAPAPLEPERASNVVELQPRRGARSPVFRRVGRWGSAAAAILLVAAIGWRMTPVGLMADYRSGVGERRTVLLDDGSQVELGTESAMDVDYSDGGRAVTLIAGEAFFTVAKDPTRPFVISTSQGKISVLGTAFNVRLDADATVAVAQSVVAVSAADDAGVRVNAGEMARFGRSGVSPVEPADLDAIAAWRNDQVVFRDAPLAEVIAELQRYRSGRIHLFGEGAGRKRVTAVFDTRRVDEALDTIAKSLGLRVIHIPGLLTAIVPDGLA
ncbi:FecR family protein [Methylopila musalis]|uniref:FecR family protein n=1 Tax=Methylopila musalis TaxID=1134781 RepID=A0ABW3Z356_9HYPH